MAGKTILDLIGNTPLVEVRNINPNPGLKILAKLESFNPCGSIKDRTAFYMISKAEERGELKKGQVILEATSGNTGIGLAMVAAVKGYKLLLIMSESASEERKKILKALGAQLSLTPAVQGTDGAIEVAYAMARENPEKYFLADQFNNPDNILAHYSGTAEEIWAQTSGKVTHVVCTLGTTGTAMGISKRLKEYNPQIKIIGVEPYLRHKIQGLKNMKESYRPGIFDRGRLDETVNILDEDAFAMARRLALEEGILSGMSSGAAMHVAVQKASEIGEGVMVVVLPDSGERYLSTALFTDKEKSSLRLYNTLTRGKEGFEPRNPERVLMHSCGPTVHLVPHIGSFRRFIVSDLLMRYLEYKGYQVSHVTNIIDLADRSIKGADRANMGLKEYTDSGLKEFLKDIATLNIRKDVVYPRASENFDAMLGVAEKLVERGLAYEKLRSIYFDISKYDDYGKLSNVDLVKMRPGRTTDNDDYEKDSPVDFTLLKRSSLAELKRGVFFKSRWGNVRPSWHLECAAVSLKYFADGFDIHSSGSDIVFPHCENVRAIGEAATGHGMANYWINSELVMVKGKKMSRSLDNYYTMEDLAARGYRGKEIRYFLLGSHYRKPLHFSFGALDTAGHTVRNLDNFVQRLIRLQPGSGLPEIDQYLYDLKQGFTGAMDDDLNISGALASLFDFINKVSRAESEGRLSAADRDRSLEALKKIDSVLGVVDFEEEVLSAEARKLLEARKGARERRDWAESDRLRERLAELGVTVQDTPEGTTWRKS